jgi:hypothetical protein
MAPGQSPQWGNRRHSKLDPNLDVQIDIMRVCESVDM